MSKILQIRMNPAVNHIIGEEQNGFVPARFIAENNMLLHEIIEYTTDITHDNLIQFLNTAL